MMGWNYSNMMGYQSFGIGTLFALVLLVDLILFGVWIWKQINKK